MASLPKEMKALRYVEAPVLDPRFSFQPVVTFLLEACGQLAAPVVVVVRAYNRQANHSSEADLFLS